MGEGVAYTALKEGVAYTALGKRVAYTALAGWIAYTVLEEGVAYIALNEWRGADTALWKGGACFALEENVLPILRTSAKHIVISFSWAVVCSAWPLIAHSQVRCFAT